MVIQRTIIGFKRVELQNHPVILPTQTWEGLSLGNRQTISNPALVFSVISWDGNALIKITPAATYKGAFAQYQTRVKQELDITVPDLAIIGVGA